MVVLVVTKTALGKATKEEEGGAGGGGWAGRRNRQAGRLALPPKHYLPLRLFLPACLSWCRMVTDACPPYMCWHFTYLLSFAGYSHCTPSPPVPGGAPAREALSWLNKNITQSLLS